MRTMLLLSVPTALVLIAAEGPVQPIPFSHRQHAGELKMSCKTCHVNPSPGDLMTYPDESRCVTCHAANQTGSESIQKLNHLVSRKEHVPWVRVYQLPTFVFWSHKTHLDTGAACSDCHGQVSTRERLFAEKPINMAGCVECHRAKKAPVHCTFCHEQRN
jgi:hypothetical protein